jgi:hypothetical protein
MFIRSFREVRFDRGIENDSTFYDGSPYQARSIARMEQNDFVLAANSLEFFRVRCYLFIEIVFGTFDYRSGNSSCRNAKEAARAARSDTS